MTETLRCPSCSGSIDSPRAQRCQWCGAPLVTTAPLAAPSMGSFGADDPRNLPRELAPLPQRSWSAGRFLLVVVVIAVFLAFAMMAFSVRAPDPSASYDVPAPSRAATPVETPTPVERSTKTKSH